MPLIDDLLTMEKQFWVGGPEAYIEHADAKCLVAFAEMASLMANDAIARTAEKGRWKEVTMTPKGKLELGDVTIITYEAAAIRKDGHALKAIVSSGYVKRGDAWKLAFHQQTPAAAK